MTPTYEFYYWLMVCMYFIVFYRKTMNSLKDNTHVYIKRMVAMFVATAASILWPIVFLLVILITAFTT